MRALTLELAVMQKKFLLNNFGFGCARLEQVQQLVSGMCVQCQIQCFASPDETPKHSNLLRRGKCVFQTIWIQGVDWICKPSIGCPCHVHAMPDLMYLEARWESQVFELVVMQKICPILTILDPELSLICKTLIACPSHVHVMWVIVYLESRWDTQTFELAVIKKFSFRFFSRRGNIRVFDLQTFDWLSVSCTCDVKSDVEARRNSQVVELVVMQKKIPFEKFWVGLLCATTTPFQCPRACNFKCSIS